MELVRHLELPAGQLRHLPWRARSKAGQGVVSALTALPKVSLPTSLSKLRCSGACKWAIGRHCRSIACACTPLAERNRVKRSAAQLRVLHAITLPCPCHLMPYHTGGEHLSVPHIANAPFMELQQGDTSFAGREVRRRAISPTHTCLNNRPLMDAYTSDYMF